MAMGCSSRGWVRGRCLGRGSTAAVYLAAASTSSSKRQSYFAVKSAELARSAPLQREQTILSSLCSPHVVSCFGSDVTAEPDGRVLFNLFVEYVPCGDLSEVIKQHRGLREHTIRLYTRGILNGLAYLHGRGIVHCDVKGHNILVSEDGESVKLADFGCARWVNDGSNDGVIVSGTPLYMAPEAARGEEQGPPADIWALGCTVIEMATGCPPWRDVEDPVAAIHRIAFSGDVPETPCNLSDDARDFLGRCLSRDPRKRWSAEELLNHPFVYCSQEFPMDNSPKSTLDQGFWDSWQEQEDKQEDEPNPHMGNQPAETFRERLRQLVGGGTSPSPAVDMTCEESCWVTVRNGGAGSSSRCLVSSEASSSGRFLNLSGEDEPQRTSSGSVVAADDGVSGEAESRGYSDPRVVAMEGFLAANFCSHFSITECNLIQSCNVLYNVLYVDDGANS